MLAEEAGHRRWVQGLAPFGSQACFPALWEKPAVRTAVHRAIVSSAGAKERTGNAKSQWQHCSQLLLSTVPALLTCVPAPRNARTWCDSGHLPTGPKPRRSLHSFVLRLSFWYASNVIWYDTLLQPTPYCLPFQAPTPPHSAAPRVPSSKVDFPAGDTNSINLNLFVILGCGLYTL